MYPRELLQLQDQKKTTIIYKDQSILGFKPANALFGVTYFGHMIPPIKPENALILGYGLGLVPDLIRKIWGDDIKFTCVDTHPFDKDHIEYEKFCMPAESFLYVNSYDFCKKYDYICVDLWNNGVPNEIMFKEEFVKRLKKVTKYLVSVNIKNEDFNKLKVYYDLGFKYLRHSEVEGNIVIWWHLFKDDDHS